MIKTVRGNLLDADVDALVNTVNTVGVMGKGIALQFKQAFPGNFEAYRKACERNEVQPGRMFVFRTQSLTNPRFIINFPTKRHWKGNARIEDIRSGLLDLVHVVQENDIQSIAVPPLGCGNGGLDWTKVRPVIEAALAPLINVRVLLYEPAGTPKPEEMKIATERPKMTLGRAVIVGLIDRYTVSGDKVSALELQKLVYFLQEAGEPLKLKYSRNAYGPYAENLQHALQRIEGHLTQGYGDRSYAASIGLLPDAAKEAEEFLSERQETLDRINSVIELTDGFESPYGMELLATVHYLAKENPSVRDDVELAISSVHAWNERKRKTFDRKHVMVAWHRLREHGWI